MKKLKSFLLFIPLLSASCSLNKTYAGLIEKLKSYDGDVTFYSDYLPEFKSYSTYSFGTDTNGDILLRSFSESYSTGYYSTDFFMRLQNSTNVPNQFECLYVFNFSTGHQMLAKFYIQNSAYSSSSISFSFITEGDDAYTAVCESAVSATIIIFDSWCNRELNYSIKDVGLFPNFIS